MRQEAEAEWMLRTRRHRFRHETATKRADDGWLEGVETLRLGPAPCRELIPVA